MNGLGELSQASKQDLSPRRHEEHEEKMIGDKVILANPK